MAQAVSGAREIRARNTSFHKSLGEPRTLVNTGLTVLAIALSLLAMFPLFSVLYMLLVKGATLLSPSLFTELTPGAGMEGGGIGNAGRRRLLGRRRRLPAGGDAEEHRDGGHTQQASKHGLLETP